MLSIAYDEFTEVVCNNIFACPIPTISSHGKQSCIYAVHVCMYDTCTWNTLTTSQCILYCSWKRRATNHIFHSSKLSASRNLKKLDRIRSRSWYNEHVWSVNKCTQTPAHYRPITQVLWEVDPTVTSDKQ